MKSIFGGKFTPFAKKQVFMAGARRLLGYIRCTHCGKPAAVFMGDIRARGWTRMECPAGHWSDIRRDSVLLNGLKH